MKRCMKTSHSEKVRISLKNHFLGTECCTWQVPSDVRMLMIDDKGAVERPETLVEMNTVSMVEYIFILRGMMQNGKRYIQNAEREQITNHLNLFPKRIPIQ